MHYLATLLFSVSFFVFSAEKARALEILFQRTKTYEHANCQKTQTCSLRRVTYITQDYRIRVDGIDHKGTRLFASYETKTVPALEEYVFVQFVRGCVYSSEMKDGVLRTYRDITTSHLGRFVVFFFPVWSVDSTDIDPAYFSMKEVPRHFFYSWEREDGKRYWYGVKKPVFPQLMITDHPSQMFVFNGWARNALLEFRTCLYRARDVPTTTGPDDIDFGQPINCFSWQSMFVYNHAKKVVDRPRSVSGCP